MDVIVLLVQVSRHKDSIDVVDGKPLIEGQCLDELICAVKLLVDLLTVYISLLEQTSVHTQYTPNPGHHTPKHGRLDKSTPKLYHSKALGPLIPTIYFVYPHLSYSAF